jgi:hypothetical protein
MSKVVRYVAQVYDTKAKEILNSTIVYEKEIGFPDEIKNFGLRHKEQVDLIKNSQDVMLREHCSMLSERTHCPRCNKKLRKNGEFTSTFHDVYTDHNVKISRLSCTCGWKSKYTVSGIYGNSSHPELLKLQSKRASEKSYRAASNDLNSECYYDRKINNYMTLKKHVEKTGETLSKIKLKDPRWTDNDKNADELIAVIDGGHIQYIEKDRHTFEELITTVFNPDCIVTDKKGNKEITDKVSVASAKTDSQGTIKKLTLNALKKQGMNKETKEIVLTDGANNCWSVVKNLEKECGSVERILDWFHIAKKFTSIKHAIPEDLIELFDKAKWHLWHGRPKTSVLRLKQLKEKITEQSTLEKIDGLVEYIERNKEYMAKYFLKKRNKKMFTSQLAETSVNYVINARQKNQQMQWSRDGAHNILQIRTSNFSNKLDEDWALVTGEIYHKAA